MSKSSDFQQKTGGFMTCTAPLVPDVADAIKTGVYLKKNRQKLTSEQQKQVEQRIEVSAARFGTASLGGAIGMLIGGPPGAIVGALIGRQFGAPLANRHYKDFDSLS